MSYRTLDIGELNERLRELLDAKQRLAETREALADGENDESATEEDRAGYAADVEAALADFGDDEAKELAELEELRDEVGADGDDISEDGAPFVHCNDFEDYARELAEEDDAIPRDAKWPLSCIDWEQAAKELAYDYSVVTFRGEDYYFRP